MSATQQTVQLMQLESRRDFLRHHLNALEKKTGRTYPVKEFKAKNATDEARAQAYQDEINALMGVLKQLKGEQAENKAYIDVVLAEKIGEDSEGISTTMSKRFGQLIDNPQGNPFVLLDETGVRFVWKNKEDADIFLESITSHGLKPAVSREGLQDSEVPEPMKRLVDNERYQGAKCCTVRIPHAQVEQLVALAQYHPYTCEATVREWYAARNIDRSTLLGQEIRHTGSQQVTDKLPLYSTEALRVPFSKTHDLVRLTVAAQEVAAQVNSVKKPHHVVILLDDSGSMNGAKMQAANQALRDFLSNLPEDTLVSIQPFNAPTLACRLPVADMKKALNKYCSTPATGGTPLCEILACSAVFVRAKPEDTIIPIEELNHTTIAVLTDGQPNGGNAKDAIAAMQQTQFQGPLFCEKAVRVNGVTQSNFISYGLPGFKCQQLPVVFPISIGSDSDQTFMEHLANAFKVPGAFVSTDTNMQQDINHAMGLLMQMRGRVGRAFLGLSYEKEGSVAAVGAEEQNLFFGRTRDIFLTIPKGSKNIQSFFMIDGIAEQQTLRQLEYVERDQATIDSVRTAFIQQQLMELKLQFAREVQEITTGLATASTAGGGTTRGGRSSRFAAPINVEEGLEDLSGKSIKELLNYINLAAQAANRAKDLINQTAELATAKKAYDEARKAANQVNNAISYAREMDPRPDKAIISKAMGLVQQTTTAAKEVTTVYTNLANKEKVLQLEKLQQATVEKVVQFQSNCKDKTLLQDLQLFADNVTKATIEQPNLTQITPQRGQIAAYTQTRGLGQVAPTRVNQKSREVDEIVTLLKQPDYEAAWEKLEQNPELINQKTSDQHGATPLISAIVLLSDAKKSPSNNNLIAQLYQLIHDMLGLPQINLTISDSRGNTALHRLAWQGETELCKEMITLAQKTDQLKTLKKKRNNTAVGATQGETILDNIRHKGNTALSKEDKITLQRLMGTVTNCSTLEDYVEEYKRDATSLNHHEPESWNTPFMQLMRLGRDETKDLQEKQEFRTCVHQLLDDSWKSIDFTESNFHGDTLLHSAIWYGEYDIANKIIAYATKQSPENCSAVLAARNTQGQGKIKGANTNVYSGGETPHMNLANRGQASLKDFQEKYNKAAELITTFLMFAPDLLQGNPPFDVLLQNILTRFCYSIPPVGKAEEELVAAEKLVLKEILWAYQQLQSWQTLCETMKSGLTVKQQTELNHLSQIYGKELEGYSAMNFLQSSPLVLLDKLIASCDVDPLDSSPAALSLKKLLLELQDQGSLEIVERALNLVDKQLAQMQPPLTTGPIIKDMHQIHKQKLSELYTKARECLVRYKDHMTGETATLNNLMGVVCATQPPVSAKSKEDEEAAVFSF